MTEDNRIDIKDYVDASSDAAKRTRTILSILVVASVLAFSGILNSQQNNWMRQRLQSLGDMNGPFTAYMLGSTAPSDDKEYAVYRERYNQLYSSMMREYIANRYTIKIPFFGISIDVADLGSLGGLAFVVILILLRFSITRELDNLKLSFEGAKTQSKLKILYYMLAMRQVLVFPQLPEKRRSRFLSVAPKSIGFLPLIIQGWMVLYDFYYFSRFGFFNFSIFLEFFFFVVICYLTIACYKRWRQIDSLWDQTWVLILDEEASKTLKSREAFEPVPDA